MRVHELMTDRPRACSIDDSANEAARIMWEQDCGAVPVLDGEGRIAGIITDRDICMAAFFQGAPLSSIRISDIMSRDVCTCVAEDDVTSAEHRMRDRQVHRLPVVGADGGLVGMLSLTDVAQGVKRSGRLRQPGAETAEFAVTVTAISEPRNGRAAMRAS
jgi:CBS domain-containing protein